MPTSIVSRAAVMSALERYFSYSGFRPHQEAIIRDALAGRDVLALLPTGGGKSLCFQLPAVVRPGLTVVVSPLIALMKDQVDALDAAGVPATFLNSSLDERRVPRAACAASASGAYRLLYVAPERLDDAGLPRRSPRLRRARGRRRRGPLHQRVGARLPARVPPARASCARRFPDAPIMALSATATERVRAGHRGDPSASATRAATSPASTGRTCSTASRPRSTPMEPAPRARASGRRGECGIVYAQSRKAASASPSASARAGSSAPPTTRAWSAADARARAGGLRPGRGRRHLRHGGVRHGHQQAQRALRRPPRPPQGPRELLPGDGPRRPRRPAQRVPAALRAGTRGFTTTASSCARKSTW